MVPVVDCKGSVLQSSDEIWTAICEVGFVYLKNCGIKPELMESMMKVSKEFFSKSSECKQQFGRAGSGINSGYVAPGVETLQAGNRKVERREAYNVTPADGVHLKWPNDVIPCFKDRTTALMEDCEAVMLDLLRVFAIKMRLQDNEFFVNAHKHLGDSENTTTLRLLHYPPISSDTEAGEPRCGEHTDYGSITLLFQDDVGGLEIMDKNGVYCPASPVQDAVLVNAGDLMEIWTAGSIKAVKHRVLTPPVGSVQRTRHRYSIAYFGQPDNSRLVAPVDGSTHYTPITSKQHLDNMLSATYG
jgi:isopenicillin N synthase-like dioxygenase